MEETSGEACRRGRTESHMRRIRDRRRRNEAFARQTRAVTQRWGGREAAMRRAMVALTWHPAEDAERPWALPLDLAQPSAGAASGGAEASAASAGATVVAAGGGGATVVAAGAGGAATAPAAGGGAVETVAGSGGVAPTAAGRGGATTAVAGSGGAGATAATGAGVIPDEDSLALHEAMEFHLGGRYWLHL
jgi:hypothetical protein